MVDVALTVGVCGVAGGQAGLAVAACASTVGTSVVVAPLDRHLGAGSSEHSHDSRSPHRLHSPYP